MVRAAGPAFIERCLSCFDRQHLKVLNAIQRCRTAALGGHVDECSRCGLRTISYNSCRNRHCPKCQGNARRRWLRARQAELLPVRYVHVVFTLPHELASLALANIFDYEVRNRMTLCRCGESQNKPLCDGTHASMKFKAK